MHCQPIDHRVHVSCTMAARVPSPYAARSVTLPAQGSITRAYIGSSCIAVPWWEAFACFARVRHDRASPDMQKPELPVLAELGLLVLQVTPHER